MSKRSKVLWGIIIVVLIIFFGTPLLFDYINYALRRSYGAARINAGNLGAIRSSLSIYYSDNEGVLPSHLGVLNPDIWQGDKFPKIYDIPEHDLSYNVVLSKDLRPTDSGGWLYVNDPSSKDFGKVIIDCTHMDTETKKVWADR